MATNNPQNYNFPSLDLAFDLAKDRVAGQLEQVDALDTKANFILGSATTLLAAALVLQAVILTVQKSSPAQQVASSSTRTPIQPSFCSLITNKPLAFSPFVILLIIYLILMAISFAAYRLRAYQHTPDPETIYKKYLTEDATKTKAFIFRAMVAVYQENKKTIDRKVFWISTAFIALGVEVVALVLILFIQVSC
jgi:hypothetical protein